MLLNEVSGSLAAHPATLQIKCWTCCQFNNVGMSIVSSVVSLQKLLYFASQALV